MLDTLTGLLPNEKVWLRDDAYHDEFPVAIYKSDGTIEKRFESETDATAWVNKNGLELQSGLPPGLNPELYKKGQQI